MCGTFSLTVAIPVALQKTIRKEDLNERVQFTSVA